MVDDLIKVFLEQVEEFVTSSGLLLEEKNYPALGRLAHKAKSSVALLGMSNLCNLLNDLEEHIRNENNIELYPLMIEEFTQQLRVTELELKEYLK